MNEGQQVTQEARPSGASIRQRVVGEVQRTAPSDPFLPPFFETAIEHVWGRVWNRPGLELKYRSLVVVSVLAATGHHEELKTHLRGALNLGWTVDELREALLQTAASLRRRAQALATFNCRGRGGPGWLSAGSR